MYRLPTLAWFGFGSRFAGVGTMVQAPHPKIPVLMQVTVDHPLPVKPFSGLMTNRYCVPLLYHWPIRMEHMLSELPGVFRTFGILMMLPLVSKQRVAMCAL